MQCLVRHGARVGGLFEPREPEETRQGLTYTVGWQYHSGSTIRVAVAKDGKLLGNTARDNNAQGQALL